MLVMLNYLEAKPKVGYTLGSQSVQQKNPALERLLATKVRDYQSAPVVIEETRTIGEAVVSLFMEDVGSLIVVDADGLLAGIVSRKDLLRVTMGNPASSTLPIGMAMTRHPNVHTVTPDDQLLAAAGKMISCEVDSLPVVKCIPATADPHKSEVVGRITKTALAKSLLDLALG